MKSLGATTWLIPDGYWQTFSTGKFPSHEAVCVLNTGDVDAKINMTLYFEDREPMAEFMAACGARRTNHVRMDKLKNSKGEAVPKGMPYAILVEASVPVVIQYSRMDTTQAEMALMTAIAFHA
jgi:hypothetical protein